jgi:hypothetical protein
MKLVFSNLFFILFYKYSFIKENSNLKVIYNNFIISLKEFFAFLDVNVFLPITYLLRENLLLRTESGETFFVTNQ